jgi:Flp pilus assembly protein TadD
VGGCAGGSDSGPLAPKELSGDGLLRIAKKAHDNGDMALSANMYAKAIQMNPDSFEAIYGLGQVAADMGDNKNAIETLEKAVSMQPKNIEARRTLASVYVRDMQPAKAQKEIEKALAIKPDAKLYNMLGISQDLQGNFKEAHQSLHGFRR